MSYLLSPSFWLNSRPGNMSGIAQIYLMFFVGVFFLFCIISAFLKRNRGLYYKIWLRLYNFFLANTIIGIVVGFVMYENLPILSARAWFLIWGLSAIVWLFFIIREISRIPKIKEAKEKEKEFKKYIP